MYRTEVVCDNMIFLNNSNNHAPEIADTDAPPVKRTAKKGDEEIAIEDIPF